MNSATSCTLNGSDTICVDENLLISFKRTLRLSDDHRESFSPPDLGTISLENVSKYATKLPEEMEPKCGLLLPMHQSDAAWIHFTVRSPAAYLVKVYVDGINAISGEPAIEDEGTHRRHLAKQERDPSSLQDYIVVPEQLWLDGISDTESNVQQFALSLRKSDGKGKGALRTIQVEVTPYDRSPPEPVGDNDYSILVRTFLPRTLYMKTNLEDTVEYFKRRIQEREGVPVNQQRLLYKPTGKKHILLEDAQKLSEYEIPKDATVYLVLRLHGGIEPHELQIDVEGKRKQVVNPDPKGDEWVRDRTVVFNVHMANPTVYRAITGARLPLEPIGKETYERHNVPFLEAYKDSSEDIDAVGLIKIGGENGGREEMTGVENDRFTNSKGPFREFRTLRDLKKELEYSSLGEDLKDET